MRAVVDWTRGPIAAAAEAETQGRFWNLLKKIVRRGGAVIPVFDPDVAAADATEMFKGVQGRIIRDIRAAPVDADTTSELEKRLTAIKNEYDNHKYCNVTPLEFLKKMQELGLRGFQDGSDNAKRFQGLERDINVLLTRERRQSELEDFKAKRKAAATTATND